MLKRVLMCDGEEFRYQAVPWHAEVMLRDLGLEEAKPAATPGAKVAKVDMVDETMLHRVYRSTVARATFVAQDRPDIRYTVKELCRRMSAPREHGRIAIKPLGRYLEGKSRLVQRMLVSGQTRQDMEVCVGQELPWASARRIGGASKSAGGNSRGPVVEGLVVCGDLHVMVDSDRPGCRESRRPTFGGCIVYRGGCLNTWSSTQQRGRDERQRRESERERSSA